MIRIVLSGIIASAGVLFGGRAVADPAMRVEPLPINFGGGAGTIFGGGPPGELQFAFYQFTNTGDQPLIVTRMTLTGADAGVISYDDGVCGQGTICDQLITLAPGSAAGFSLRCLPTAPGFLSATLEITSNATATPLAFPISCVANRTPVIEVTPGALDFGTQHSCWPGDLCGSFCATRPAAQSLVITNTAAPPSELDFELVLPPAGRFDEFTINSPQFPYALAAGESLQLDFVFHPLGGHLQSYNEPIDLISLYPGQAPIEIPLHARGGFGALQMDSPAFLGIAPVGQTLSTTITAHNVGVSCLSVSDVGSNGDVFATGQTSAFLLAGEAFTWTVECTPTAVLSQGSSLDFHYSHENLDMETFPFYCEGAGGALVPEPGSAFFLGPDAAPIGGSATQRVRVFNRGNQPTDLRSITSSDPHVTAAPATGSLPITLAPGADVAVDVTFTPTETEPRFATLTFDGSNGDDYVMETGGEGVVVSARVAPTRHDFGRIDYPETPVQRFRLRNTGSTTLTARAVALDGPGDFAISGIAAGTAIEPGATLTFHVRATPTGLGRRHASLVLDLGLARPITIPLEVLARDPALAVKTDDASPNDYELAFGRVDIDRRPGHHPEHRRITLRNTTAAAISLASCAITGDPAFTVAACPTTIARHKTATIDVVFAPTANGEATAALAITGSFATGALRIELAGRGVDRHAARPRPDMSFADTATIEVPNDGDPAIASEHGGGCATTVSSPPVGLVLVALLCLFRLRPRQSDHI